MPAQFELPGHSDAGLQPERTDLAWRRTTLSMVMAAAIFLRWMNTHGWFAGSLVLAATVTAVGISVTRKHRFHRAIRGINEEQMHPNIHSQAAIAASVVVLTVLGIYAVLFLPLDH